MKFYKSALAFAVCGLLAACGSDSGGSSSTGDNTGGDNTGGDNTEYNTSLVTPTAGTALTIHMIGDSTMAPYTEDRRPQMGWAEQMPMFFDEDTAVNNWARGGRSSLSFYNYDPSKNPHWPNIQPTLVEGDYVIIQFGHNDQKYGSDYEQYGTYAFCSDGSTTADGAEACTDTEHSYYLNLKKFVEETQAMGAQPILMSPIVRAYFEGDVISEKGQHNIGILGSETVARGDYPAAMEALAERYSIPYVDLTAATKTIVEQYGPSGYTNLYYNDSTHPNELYAALIAKAAAEGLQELGIMTDHIVAADTMIVANPSELDFGKRYLDVSETKSITLSAFSLTPETGTITVTSPDGFKLADTSSSETWEQSFEIAYTNGAFTEDVYVQFTPTEEKSYTGNLELLQDGNTLETLAVSGEGVAIGASVESYSNWFTAGKGDLTATADGLVTGAEVTLSEALTKGFGSDKIYAINGQDTVTARVYSDHDYSSDKYIEFKVTAASQPFNVTSISAYFASSGTSNVTANIAYSLSADFSSPVTVATELTLTKDVMEQFEYPVTEQVPVDSAIYVRIYPWMKSASEGGRYLALYDVSIDGLSGE
ncbi:GDSL-type esterase/lipase family protein [Vibrio ziniensis]|uniref:SGNH hydrolase-type esterase domain-containing protein n=1 Tax=Vibrio ziniensis TaxID=2711221 RepID=A0A6G7CEX0_9VIBR|nr:GDSL-type esterase/lipase family protein [Vibrio ziniensis]QIH40647.1 hypothetical protein G5S32_01055 [Vibrio ziniensis]QOT69941.1 rhamnogalacturonan acetylesterase [Vibrio ziniensis]